MLPAMPLRPLLTATFLALVCMGGPRSQGSPHTQTPYTPPPDNLDWKPKGLEVDPFRFGLTGDWFGLREDLRELGIGIGGRLIWETSEVYRGGLDKRWSDRWFADAGLIWELGPTLGIPGASFYGEIYWRDGDLANTDLGAIQVPSTIEGPNEVKVREAWYQQEIWGELLRVKIGRLDGSKEFHRLEYGMEFLNRTGTRTPSLLDPSAWPLQGNGVELFVKPEQELTLGLGIEDRSDSPLIAPTWEGDSWLFTVEGRIDWWDDARRGRIMMGYFRHTGGFVDGDGATRTQNWGWYVGGEKDLYRVETPGGGATAISLLTSFTYGDRWVASARKTWQFGLRFQGLVPTRKQDSLGILGSLVNRNIKRGWPQDRNEFFIETYYRIDLGGFLFLQPDLQYFVHPGGLSTRRESWLATLRATLVF